VTNAGSRRASCQTIGLSAVVCLACVVCACASPDGEAPPPATLRPVALPDLSRLAPSVQKQLRNSYASLSRKVTQSTAPAERANAYGDLGKLLLAAEVSAEAEACLLNAAALQPDDGRWPYYLGYLHRKGGDLAKATAFFEQSLQRNPEDVATLVRLGTIHLDQDRTETAESFFARALSRDPQSAAALFGVGRAALAKHDYPRAVEYLERALAQDPRATIVHYPLALAYRGRGELDKADAHLRLRGDNDATFPDPLVQELDALLESAMAYQSRGIQALGRGDWRQAEADFRKGIELGPDSASLRHRLGTALFLSGNLPAAIEQFESALRLSPDFAQAHYSLGVILASSGRYEEAIERFAAAVKDQPDYIEARLALADTLRGVGRAPEALRQYESISAIDPRVPEGRFGFAMTLVVLQRYREARDVLADGARLLPERTEFTQALARVLSAAPDSAVRDGPRALQLAQALLQRVRSVDALETLAMAQAEAGQFEQAASSQREAMGAAAQGGDAARAARMTGNLKLYEARRPCRTPWRPGEVP
jgi:tetratricopeptide (TPR) repeat protein